MSLRPKNSPAKQGRANAIEAMTFVRNALEMFGIRIVESGGREGGRNVIEPQFPKGEASTGTRFGAEQPELSCENSQITLEFTQEFTVRHAPLRYKNTVC